MLWRLCDDSSRMFKRILDYLILFIQSWICHSRFLNYDNTLLNKNDYIFIVFLKSWVMWHLNYSRFHNAHSTLLNRVSTKHHPIGTKQICSIHLGWFWPLFWPLTHPPCCWFCQGHSCFSPGGGAVTQEALSSPETKLG